MVVDEKEETRRQLQQPSGAKSSKKGKKTTSKQVNNDLPTVESTMVKTRSVLLVAESMRARVRAVALDRNTTFMPAATGGATGTSASSSSVTVSTTSSSSRSRVVEHTRVIGPHFTDMPGLPDNISIAKRARGHAAVPLPADCAKIPDQPSC